ncbi:MAG: Asp-tRNA(Asn)/Glu-tRNA(Gln) amidotransferase subunit GatA [Candidatus Paceibacterota bacterium]
MASFRRDEQKKQAMLKPEITIKEFHEGLVKKDFSASEAAEFFLNEIKEKDGEVKAFLEVWRKEAKEEAKEVDLKIEKGERVGYLTGIPIAIKDIILKKGKEFTAGSKILKGYKAEYDSTVVSKLKKEGAVFLGRTNMDEFAFGSTTEQSAWQVTRNPIDLERVPGGTSGGSAAALAGGMAVAALGTDTGGSVRQPASFCGAVGLRPTYGAVSRFGVVAAASSFDQVGPITKTVEDAAILFKAIVGKDKLDSTTIFHDFSEEITNPDFKEIKELTIGIPEELFDEERGTFKGLDERTALEMKKATEKLKNSGMKFKKISLPNSEYALSCYYISIFAEESSNLARFDGLRYGAEEIREKVFRKETLKEIYLNNKSKGFGDEAKRRIILGTFVLSSGFYDAYYGKAQKVRRMMRTDFERAFYEVDAILMPTAPTVAFKIGEKINDPLQMYYGDIFTVAAPLAGLPAISIPTEGLKAEKTGLPVGFQLIGKKFREEDILGIGQFYEKI